MSTITARTSGNKYNIHIEVFDTKDETNKPMEYHYRGVNAHISRNGREVLIRKYNDERVSYVHARKDEIDPILYEDLKELAMEMFDVKDVRFLTDEGYRS